MEASLLHLFDGRAIGDHLDIGTGTGRMLELFAGQTERGVGIDLNHKMLSMARSRLEEAGISHCQVRHGDMYRLPFGPDSFDVVTVHQVLHFADDPAAVIREAARTMRPGAQIAVVDFALHELEELRENHAHRRLGFSDDEVVEWLRDADDAGVDDVETGIVKETRVTEGIEVRCCLLYTSDAADE